MPAWVAWTGWGLSVFQFVLYLLDKKARDVQIANIVAARKTLAGIRAMCSEAIETQEIINSAPARHFARQVAYSVLGVENMLEAVLPKSERADGSKQLTSQR